MAVVGGSINRLTGRPKLPVFGAVSAAAAVADLLLDFANGVYRKDGTSGTFAALGGTLSGAAAVTGGSGVLCNASGDSAQIPYTFSGDFIVVAEYAIPSTALRRLFRMNDSDNDPYFGAYVNTNTLSIEVQMGAGNAVSLGTIFGSSKVATGYSSGAQKGCKNGGTVSSTTLGSSPVFTSGTMIVGNSAVAGTEPWGAFIKSVALYKGTFSDAQIQALST